MLWQLCLLATAFGNDLASPSEQTAPSSNDEDFISLLQTSMKARLGSSLHMKIDHDVDFNECDRSRPEPPAIGIWEKVSAPSRFARGLNAKVIVDIGGNRGSDVVNFRLVHPNARIFTFEPLPALFNTLKAKFAQDYNVFAQNVGVSNATGQTQIILEDVDGIGSTAEDHNSLGEHLQVQLSDVDEVLAKIEKATGQAPDVFSMNCEGCEYTVMKRMAEKGWLSKIPHIQLSWHRAADVKDRVAKRCEVESLLWQTHTRTWRSEFGWVGWQAVR